MGAIFDIRQCVLGRLGLRAGRKSSRMVERLGICAIPADSLIEEDADLLPSLLCRIGKYWKAVAGFAFIPLVLIVVLAMLAVPDAARASILATIGIIIVGAAIPLALVWLDCRSGAREILRSDSRPKVRVLCGFVFFPVFVVYLLSSDRMGDVPPALEFGVVVIAAALGGLVLNAGVSSGVPCKQRREFIAVAQKFVVVVILGIIFPPIMWFVDFFGGVDIMSFEPGNPSGWVLGPLSWIGVSSFFAGVTFFIVALVDLVYAMIGLGGAGCGCKSSGRDGSCDARMDADAS